MPYFDYPVAADLEAFLTGHGLDVSAYADQLGDMVDAGVSAFEEAAGRVMLAAEGTRYYDPPTGGQSILFVDDLSSEPTISYQPQGSTAETLVLRTDYWLEPANALAKKKPLTMIRFRRRWATPLGASLLQSLAITGLWGYSTELRADVRTAMLMKAAGLLWTSVVQGETGGRLSIAEADRREDFGVESWSRLIKAWTGEDGRGGEFGRVVAQYRKLGC